MSDLLAVLKADKLPECSFDDGRTWETDDVAVAETFSRSAARIEALEIALGNMIEHYINAEASVDCYGDPNTDNVVLEARAILKEVANV